jgi:hypothetical protein
MGQLKSFVESKGITAAQIAVTSSRIEAADGVSRTALEKRAAKRRDKESATKKYAELNLAKPATSGRGISAKQVEAALAEKEVSRKARGKILRAVNVILTAKKDTAADMKVLFEGTKARAGKKPEKPEKK